MKRHLFIIDPLDKLNLKKDSTLMLALTMQQIGFKVAFLFENDFSIENKKSQVKIYPFKGILDKNFSAESLRLEEGEFWSLDKKVTLHMRLDPPFDKRYLRILWLLKLLEYQGVEVANSPLGVAAFNEKIYAYAQKNSHPSWIGSNLDSLKLFCHKLKKANFKYIILKPLDLYQGFGVEKVLLNDPQFLKILERNIADKEMLVAQPYIQNVEKGEIRSIFYKGRELGSILKVPQEGKFLANIAQGASYHAIKLSTPIKRECVRISKELLKVGVPWIAYDILDKKISEVNITCPGLLVEVSKAHKKNLANLIIQNF